ncbi:unnamed protein product [Mytilus coruscus]|uniref:Uncharacterized protein n=1 Tax=Mytilus coruscus TaxID=42192 RepID=A0A6J8DJH0_MYTCO|nr:unnamed protein product [Mytilus coruscus]
MPNRTDNNFRQNVIYLSLFVFTIAAGVTEFPCTFPSPWIGQTFSITILGLNAGNWKFNADCQTSVFTTNLGPSTTSETWLCHQITERFLIVRVQGSDNFVCFPIFSNLANPLKFTFGSSASTTFENQTGELTDICEICKQPAVAAVALASPTQPPDCEIPSMCSTPGIACASNDIIPKGSGCPILTTETSTTTIFVSTTTTQEPTTTTPEPTTTTPVPTTATPEPTTTTPEPTTTIPEPTTTTPKPTTTSSEPITTTPVTTTTTPEPTTTTPEPTTTTPEPTTTTPEPTTTIPEPTTTTSKPTTLPEPKTTTKGHHGHCRKRNHPHP